MIEIEVAPSTIPTHLYHYTSPAGCIGIIQSGAFWATQIEYMNDSKEIRHAVELAKDFINTEHQIPNEIKKETLDELEFITKGVTKTFVVSFSEHEDWLSQWRAYCPNGGASIGICREKISNPSGDHPDHRAFQLVKCIYKKDEQDEKIEQFFHAFLEQIDALKEGRDKPLSLSEIRDLVSYGFGKPFTRLAAQMKHESFSDEAEWRLVGQPAQSRKYNWRAGSDMVIPYYEYNFNRGLITSLCAGPAKQPEDARMALSSLALLHGVHVRVSKTETSYRKG